MTQHLGQQGNSIKELAGIQGSIIILTVVVFPTRLLISSIEDLNPILVGDHASLYRKLDELGDVHGAILITLGLIQLMKSRLLSLFQSYAMVRHLFKLK